MNPQRTGEKNDDSLGVVFKNPQVSDREKLNMDTPLSGKSGRKNKSILSSSEDVFDIGHAFKSGGDVERGTIVTDKRHVHIGMGEMLAQAFSEWFTKTRASIKRVEILEKKEPVTIAPPETRKEVIKEAAAFTKQVPKDDHTIIIEKLKTLNRDASRITGRPFLIKKPNEEKTFPTVAAKDPVLTPEPPTARAESWGGGKTLDMRATSIASTVLPEPPKETMKGSIQPTPASEPGLPLMRTYPREKAVDRGSDATFKSTNKVSGDIPENLPGIVHAEVPEHETADATGGWSFFRKDIEERPINVSYPEWDVEKSISEVLSNPAPTPEEARRVEQNRKEADVLRLAEEKRKREAMEHEEMLRRQREEAERKAVEARAAAERAEREREAQKKAEEAMLKRAEDERLRRRQAEVATSLREEHDRAAMDNHRTFDGTSNLPEPKHIKSSSRFPRWLPLVVLVILIGIVAGVGSAVIVARKDIEHSTPQIESPFLADAQVESAFGTTRDVFVGSLSRAVHDAPAGITHIVVRTASGMPITPGEFFSSLDARVLGSFTRALDDRMAIGSVSLLKNEPFILFHTNTFESAFAGMLDWELRMQRDLAPLFDGPGAASTSTAAEHPFSRTSFADATAGNNSIRILRDGTGNEILIYAFVNRSTLIITSKTEALSAILLKLR